MLLQIFFFNDTATTEIYTLSLHDALPISGSGIERDPGERRLRPLGKAHRARPVVMAREPESVDRAVPNGGIEMVDPVVSWIRLGGSLCIEPAREQDCDGEGVTGSPHGAQVCSKTCAVS